MGTQKAQDWETLVSVAASAGTLPEVMQLDRALRRAYGDAPPEGLSGKPVRLAVLGSASVEHLLPGLRVGALQRGLWLAAYTPAYGQYMQELMDAGSALHRYKPNAVLFSLHAEHLFGATGFSLNRSDAEAMQEEAAGRLRQMWRLAKQHFNAQVIQQMLMPLALPLLGNNEQRLPTSLRRLTFAFNERLRTLADEEGVDILALDERVMEDGMAQWHNPVLWHMAKQEISPAAAPAYGETVARLLAAQQGKSYKCLVLDLDNTLWGGVIGDDGLEGIVLGQGSARGEAHLALQRYALDLSRRGIILAVCSKNDEANALLPFAQHPEMLLKQEHIACFMANWQDKAANLREIAAQLNIGLDALVFVDDNPFERNIVRRELPMVAVPELPEDPALYASFISARGYFESLGLTAEDMERAGQYQANTKREQLKASATNIEEYLRTLEMKLHYGPFDDIGLQRIVQLINKTNQFNLTTRRYTESEVRAAMNDPRGITLQLRLTDTFGDNGIIGIVIGRREGTDMLIDTWLMSCRVLGRGVEKTTLNLVAAAARQAAAESLIGEYRPSAKNGMVREHYAALGFAPLPPEGENTRWKLSLKDWLPYDTFIATMGM